MKRSMMISLVTFGLLFVPLGMSRIGSETVPSLGLAVAQAASNPYKKYSSDNRYWGGGDDWWTGKGCYNKPVQFDCGPQPSTVYCNKDGSWNYKGYKCYKHHKHMRACYDKKGKSRQWWC